MELFVDCMPRGGPYNRFHEVLDAHGLFEEVDRVLEEQYGIEDPPDYWNANDYGKGGKALAEVVKQNIDLFAGKRVVVERRLPGVEECLPTLRRAAETEVFAI